MKFIADNIRELSRKNKEKNIKRSIKRSIRMVRNKIKMEARDGEDKCFVDFYENFNDNQQKIISDYFIKKGFKVEWLCDDSIVVRWV